MGDTYLEMICKLICKVICMGFIMPSLRLES